ncbi:MAG: GTP cyclohydrolase I [Candidatus Peribacteraceae bacterium]|nr:GTP cyclohydrolase I [Candidatus Peribacteraceae bacterium]
MTIDKTKKPCGCHTYAYLQEKGGAEGCYLCTDSRYNNIMTHWEGILDELYKGIELDWRKDINLMHTPHRIAKSMLHERCKSIGQEDNIVKHLDIMFESDYNGFVVCNPVTAESLCPHHFENVTYEVYMGYCSKDKVVGLSKIGRVIKDSARQPILQEDYTKMLADLFEKALQPEGVGLVVKGQHNCMISRGLQQPGIWVTTSEMRGTFRDNHSVKDEFLELCKLKGA